MCKILIQVLTILTKRIRFQNFAILKTEMFSQSYNLLCVPEFVPQMTGGAMFPGAVTEN